MSGSDCYERKSRFFRFVVVLLIETDQATLPISTAGMAALLLLQSGRVPIDKLIASNTNSIEDDRRALEGLLKMVDRGNPDFELVLLP